MKSIRIFTISFFFVWCALWAQQDATLFVIDKQLHSVSKESACPLTTWAHDAEMNAAICCLIQDAHEIREDLTNAIAIIKKCMKNGIKEQTILTIAKNLGFSLTKLTGEEEPILQKMLLKLYDQTVLIKHENVGTLSLDEKGYLNPESAKKLLLQLYSEGKFKNEDFANPSCVQAKDLISARGQYTTQLFLINACNNKDYILKEMSLGVEEATKLTQADLSGKLAAFIAPAYTKDFPQFVFPVLYISYMRRGTTHILSLQPKAEGMNLAQYFVDFGKANLNLKKSNTLANKKAVQDTQKKLQDALYIFGFTMAHFYKHFMIVPSTAENILQPTLNHGDLHIHNIIRTPSASADKPQIVLIDNERVIDSILAAKEPTEDLNEFFGLLPIIMFKPHYTNIVDIFGPLEQKVRDTTIYDAYYYTLKGFLNGWFPSDKKAQLSLVNELDRKLYKLEEYVPTIQKAFGELKK